MSWKSQTKTTTTALLVLLTVISATASSKCKKQPVADFAKTLAQSFEGKTMAQLDATRSYSGTFRIVIEHSLADDDSPDLFVVRRFRSLAAFEKWLKSREIEGLPGRNSMPLVGCARGVCKFQSDVGILHNNLYLKRVTYGIRNGCPYIKTIYLLDGD
jgi:hypothetical protein